MANVAIIPECVTDVTVKKLLSISQLGFADQCLLRVAFGASIDPFPRLPDHPSAKLGSILHQLLDQATKGHIPRHGLACDDAEAALNKLLVECGTDFSSAFSPHEWSSRNASAISLAAKRLEDWSRPAKAGTSIGRRIGFEELPNVGVWGEVVIKSNGLRLTGQIDIVEKRNSHLTITDTKTGRIEDRNGAVLGHIDRQLRLYGLAAREYLEFCQIELFVERERKWSISFDTNDETETRQWLQERLCQLPHDIPIEAKSIACVGEACRTCPYRHICPSYREAAPRAWKEGTSEGPFPEDIWGRIERIGVRDGMCDIEIRDEANRRVRILGINEKWNFQENFTEGLPVFFFGLAAEKPQFHRGTWKHNLNFHENPSSRRGRRALSLAVFCGK